MALLPSPDLTVQPLPRLGQGKCDRLARAYRNVGDVLPPINFRAGTVETGDWNDSGRNRRCRRHGYADRWVRSTDNANRDVGQVVSIPTLHSLSELIERRTENRKVVYLFIETKRLVICVGQKRRALSSRRHSGRSVDGE